MVALQFVMSLSITLQVKVSDFALWLHQCISASPYVFSFFPLSLSIVSEQQRKRHIFTLSATPPECAYSPTWKSIHTQKLQHTHSPQHVHATFMHFFVDNIKQLMWWFFEFLVESLCIQSPTKTYITSEYMVFSLNDQTFLHLVIWLFY